MPSQARAVAGVGAVRVALFVGERVVLAVVGDPVDHAALQRHRAEDRQRVAQPRARLEGAMGQQPVEADGDADRRQQVHDREDHEVARAEEVIPQQHRGHDHRQKRDHDGGDVGVALEAGHLSLGIPMRATRVTAFPPFGGVQGRILGRSGRDSAPDRRA